MAIHAAANIAMAVDNFKNRGYAELGGFILNRRDVPREEEKVEEISEDKECQTKEEEQKKTCIKCGTEIEEGDAFCLNCGESVE